MIGKLSGRVDSIDGNQIILDVGGVGYLVGLSLRTRERLSVGEAAALLIETHLREDALLLFGFADKAERDAFRLLTTVQGVGAKAALSILGLYAPNQLAEAIASGDKAALARADGVGPKLALRIVTELKEKAPLIGAASFAPDALRRAPGGAAALPMDDALSALVNLGYPRMEAFGALNSVRARLGDKAELDALIRAALGELSRIETRRGEAS